MLAELRVHAASRRDTPPRFRPYLAEAVRYWSTGLRQSRAWAPHLANARGLIDTGIDDFPVRRTVVVLGAGPLFELPLESLARTFARVVLVDRAHLSAIRPRLARYGNIERQWRDLSPATSVDPLAFLAGIADLDWVISANLLGSMALAAPAGQHRQVIEDHLAALAALPCPATLITDLDYRVFNRHGVVLDSADLMHGRFMPRSGLRWKWEAAPFGADQRHTRRVHSVAAWPDWREADFG
ncbi:MAG: hypothetical protein J0I99_05170 [Devosia sp.]|uniref:hypothetical protein n=1 Tax=Devosia sp. TaxID=1871048 RepID=UPI001ACDD3C6|nr:hypothetical protein [Devosia sp.]MBN9315108.1 hypothetical protein [Devosia sp.]